MAGGLWFGILGLGFEDLGLSEREGARAWVRVWGLGFPWGGCKV